MQPHGHPIAELVLTVLSQTTNDRNRDVAYLRLRERLPSWEAVRARRVAEVEEAIRPGGISKVKSARIQAILRAIADDPGDPHGARAVAGLAADAPLEEARDYLTALPGRRAQDGGLRAAVRLRPARRAGRHARLARGHAPGAAAPGRAVRGAARPDARADPAGRGARAAREPAAPRTAAPATRAARRAASARSRACAPAARCSPDSRAAAPRRRSPRSAARRPRSRARGRPRGSRTPSATGSGRSLA